MTDEAAATINGVPTTKLRLSRPRSGPWHIDADMADDSPLAGAVKVQLLGSTLKGVISEPSSGTFGLQRLVRVIGGAGGWAKELPPKAYPNDAGVKASKVAQDAAAEAGETLGGFAPLNERLGVYWARDKGPAAAALEAAAGGPRWWVDYDGITNVGAWPTLKPTPGSYEVLSYDVRNRMATIAIDTLGAIDIGSVLTERLDAPTAVGAFELEVTSGRARMIAWLRDGAISQGADALVRIIERVQGRKLWGVYRYRVVQTVGDRLQLQAISRSTMPDLPSVSMWPGVSGTHATMALGVEVLVQFEAGLRSAPMVTGFVGRGGPGDVPDRLEIGGKAEQGAARNGDTVEIQLPPMAFTGVIGILPASGILSALIPKTLGTIVTGSSRVNIA